LCTTDSCKASEVLDVEESNLAQLRASIKKADSVPCDQIDTSEPFCCWWPQPFTCGTCQQCTAGWGSCPQNNPHQCPGSGAGPTPTPAPPFPTVNDCNGPLWGKDNGGVNMNDGSRNIQPSADACQSMCEYQDGCAGYTWKTDSLQCWLKSSVSGMHRDSLSASGNCNPRHPATPSPTPAPFPTVNACNGPLQSKDNGGVNMNDGSQNIQPSADVCRSMCQYLDGCAGYTWKTDSHQCWLKSSVSGMHSDNLSESGNCYPLHPATRERR